MLRNIFCWKGFGPVTGPPSFPGANFQQMVIARLSLGLSFLGLRNFLKLCHDEKPCTWWLGGKGLGSLQSRLARMLHHEYDALKRYRFLGGAISFYSVSCMSDVIFNPSLLNWSSLILTVAHIDIIYLILIHTQFHWKLGGITGGNPPFLGVWHWPHNMWIFNWYKPWNLIPYQVPSFRMGNNTLQWINISHLRKRKIIFKMPFWGDTLVPWRVLFDSCIMYPLLLMVIFQTVRSVFRGEN